MFGNRHELFLHRTREHFNQHGRALQPRPLGRDEAAPWDGDDALRQVYEANAPLILEHHRQGSLQSMYMYPTGIWCWTFHRVRKKPIACVPKSFQEKIPLCTSRHEENVLLPYDRYQRLLSKDEPSKAEQDSMTSLHAEEPLDTNESSTKGNLDAAKYKETLILRFPKSMQNRVRNVLDYIQPHVTWNDKGEVSIQDRDILGSNIVDLLKVHLKDYKEFYPVGKDAFRTVLCELNVPMSLLASSVRQQTGRGNLPPSPGIPSKRPEDAVQKKRQMASPMKYEDYLASIY